MITPVFEITQDDANLTFKIRAPYAKLSGLEIEHTGNLFLFSCKPYFLRINLPHDVQEDAGESTSYDTNSGIFTVVVPKLTEGQHFEGLDMINTLLDKPQKLPSGKRLVEEIDDEQSDEEYYHEQRPVDVNAGIKDEEANEYGYGFGWRRTGVIEQLREQIGDLFGLNEPEVVPIYERAHACKNFDIKKFNYERYLTDNLQADEELHFIIEAEFGARLELTENDRTKLKDFPKRKLPKLSEADEKATIYSLVDIVFAWAYDQRVNDWESSCESGWTISHLSPSLSFLLKWSSVREACVGSFRRILCYPLYRNWDLAVKLLKDVTTIFTQGQTALLHILCDIHSIMIASSEFRYLFNDILISDLILWIQTVKKNLLHDTARELLETRIDKEDMDLDLNEIELNGRVLLMAIENQDSDDEVDSDD